MPYDEKNGKWRGVVKDKKTGKRVTKTLSTKREAVEWENKENAERDRLNATESFQGQRNNYVGPWLEGYLLSRKNKNQTREWREKLNFFKKFIEFTGPAMPVSKLTPSLIMKFLDRDQSRSGNARNKDLDRLQWAWNWAVKVHDFPFKSPFMALEKFPELRKAKYIPPLGDVLKVIEAAEGEEKLALLLCLATAARRVEIFRIHVDTDFLAEDNIVVLTTEKTNGKGQRRDKMKIPEDLCKEIQKHVIQNEIKGNLFNYSRTDRGDWDDWLKNICTNQAVKPFSIHGIRHRVATELIKKKVSLTDVQSLLRHTRASTTDKYIHSIGEHLDVTYHASSMISTIINSQKVA